MGGDTSKMKCLGAYPLLTLAYLLSMLLPLHAEDVRRCFVCTEKSSPKCSGELSSSDTGLIKECPVGIGAKGVPKGCQILSVMQTTEFVYPKRDLIWRDCLYPTDLEEHGLEVIPSEDDPEENEMWWWRGSSWTGSVPAMNEKRGKLRLPLLPSYDMSMESTFALIYYHPNPHLEFWNLSNGIGIDAAGKLVSRGFNKISRGQREVKGLANRSYPNDGEAIVDLRKQASSRDAKINGTYKCLTWDKRQSFFPSKCDHFPSFGNGQLDTPQSCNSPRDDDSYGCIIFYEEAANPGKTTWVRRECWYKGEVHCLKGLPKSQSESCTKLKSGGECKPRALIKDGKLVIGLGGENSRRRRTTTASGTALRISARSIMWRMDSRSYLTFTQAVRQEYFTIVFAPGRANVMERGLPISLPTPQLIRPPLFSLKGIHANLEMIMTMRNANAGTVLVFSGRLECGSLLDS